MKTLKGKVMTAARYRRGESLLQICGWAEPEADTSGRVQSGHAPEPSAENKGWGEGNQVQQPGGKSTKVRSNQNIWII